MLDIYILDKISQYHTIYASSRAFARAASAIMAPLQWIASFGDGSKVSASTRSMTS